MILFLLQLLHVKRPILLLHIQNVHRFFCCQIQISHDSPNIFQEFFQTAFRMPFRMPFCMSFCTTLCAANQYHFFLPGFQHMSTHNSLHPFLCLAFLFQYIFLHTTHQLVQFRIRQRIFFSILYCSRCRLSPRRTTFVSME